MKRFIGLAFCLIITLIIIGCSINEGARSLMGVRLGMTTSEVIGILGQPKDDFKKSRSLNYDSPLAANALTINIDENGRVYSIYYYDEDDVSINLAGIKMGDNNKIILNKLGKPDYIYHVGFFGSKDVVRWVYKKKNIGFVINKHTGKVVVIAVLDYQKAKNTGEI